jgi:biotin--protein ligase
MAAFVSYLLSSSFYTGLTLNMPRHDRDQRILLTTTNPHTTVRILGITADHGLLRTVPERRNTFDPRTSWRAETEYVDLQPDGNSFDLMAGLIKTKT